MARPDIIFIYITAPSSKVARSLSKELVESGLAACTNIFPIESMYKWDGKLKKDKEYAIIVKTAGSQYKKIVARIEAIHPYDTACITKIRAEPNKRYTDWLLSQLRR